MAKNKWRCREYTPTGNMTGSHSFYAEAVLQRRPGENRPAIPAEPQEGRQGRGTHAGDRDGGGNLIRKRTVMRAAPPDGGAALTVF